MHMYMYTYRVDAFHAVIVINTEGVIQFVNKNLVKLFGYKRADELRGKNVKILMPVRTHNHSYIVLPTFPSHLLSPNDPLF